MTLALSAQNSEFSLGFLHDFLGHQLVFVMILSHLLLQLISIHMARLSWSLKNVVQALHTSTLWQLLYLR